MALDLKITASLNDNMSLGLNLITSALGKNKKAAELAKKGLLGLSSSATAALNSLSGLVSAFKSGNILSFGQGILGASTSLGGLTTALGTATGAASGLGAALNLALGPIGLVTAAIAGIGAVGYSAAKAASELEVHLDSFQSLTGIDDTAIKEVSKSALEMSKQFGSSAADVVDSMKLIGGQAPELLKNQKALEGVTEAANVLALAGEIEVVDSARAITGVMNQMGASANEAKNIINTLAAAAQEGSYEIDLLNEVFGKAGTMAKTSGMNYTQLAALTEAVGGKFTEASVLGTSLNSTLIALSVQGNNNFKPAVVGMQLAIENLAKAELSDQEMKELVGATNVKLLKSMIETRGEYERLQGAISNTNTAYDMAAQNTDNLEGTITKLKSSWDALMISLGQSALILGIISIFLIWMDAVRDCINYISELLDQLPGFGEGVSFVDALGAAIKALTIPTKIVWELIAVAISAIITYWNTLVKTVQWVWDKLKSIMSDMGIFKPIKEGLTKVIDWFKKMIDSVLGLWNKFKKAIGMDVKEIKQEAIKLDDSPTSTGNKSTQTDVKLPTTTGKKTKVKVKVEAEEGSLDALKKKLSDLQKSLTSKNLSVVDIQKTKKQIEDLQKEIDKKEMELGIKAKPGSLEYIENEISKIDDQLKKLNPKIDVVKIEELKADKSALEALKKDVESSLLEVVVTSKKFETKGREGSLLEAQDRVQYYKARINTEVIGSEDYEYLKGKIKEWQTKEEIIRLKVDADLSDAAKGSMKWLAEKKAYWQGKLDISAYGTPEYIKAKNEIDKLTKEENKIKLQVEIDGMSDLEKTFTMLDGFHAIDGVVGSFESLSNAINENANAWEIFMGILLAFESVMAAVNAVSQIANMLSGIAAGVKTAETAATVSASAAEKEKAVTDAAAVAPATALTVANKALEVSYLDLASAMIFAAHASIPFVGVGLATGFISTMLSIQAATKAATLAMAAFETGGIIGGNSYHGDKLIARVNSGEMILNGRLLRNLFDAINENRLGGENSNRLYGEVKVKGQDLYIALSNFGKVKSTLGKQIGIR